MIFNENKPINEAVLKFINTIIPTIIHYCGNYYIHEPIIKDFSVIIEFEVCRYSEDLRLYLSDVTDGVSVSISQTGHALYTLTINKFD